MEALRSDKDDMLAQAIWSTMQEVTSAILQTDDSCEDTPQESSSAVHKITRSIERYIRLLEINYRSVDQIVRKAADCG
jgi:regulator of sigma D